MDEEILPRIKRNSSLYILDYFRRTHGFSSFFLLLFYSSHGYLFRYPIRRLHQRVEFLLIINKDDVCISTLKPKGKAVGFYMLRYLLYGLGLTIALLLQHFGFNIFNVFAVLGAYLLQKITIIVYGLKKGEAE